MSVQTSARRARALGLGLGVALFAAAWSVPAGAANWFEKTFYMIGPRYDSQLPACDNWWALGKIQSRFSTKERRFWNSDLSIVTIESVREVAYRPWAEGTIPRRYCEGRAQTSDGKWRKVRYSIVEDLGVIGTTWSVDWCVSGVDRNLAYSPDCKAAGP